MSTTTAAASIGAMFTDVSVLVAAVVTGTLGIAIALLGVGYGYRLAQRRITGKRF